MNIKWNGKGEFSGDFSEESLRSAQEEHSKRPVPQLSDMFRLMKDEELLIDSPLPLVCECDCGTILEAPLMRGSKQCCTDSLKQMMFDWLVDNRDSLNVEGEEDLLGWAVWLQDWIEQFNSKPTGPVTRSSAWDTANVTFKIIMIEEGDDDGPKTDRRVD